ncbi:MAG: hypothetical protein ACOY3P_02720 [Planctomycetota bacterium]
MSAPIIAPPLHAAEPLFRSGFGPATRVEAVQPAESFIVGKDAATGADWSALGGPESPIAGLAGRIFINVADKNPSHAGAEVVRTHPAGPSNPALRLWVLDDDPASSWVTRSCIRLDYRYGTVAKPEFAFRRCHVKYRMLLAAEYAAHITTARNEWFQIFETWDCGRQWNQPELSINVRVIKNGSKFNLEFSKRIKGTDGKFTVAHRMQNASFSLPFGRWVDVEFYYNPGFENEKGRFLWRMDGTTVFDIAAGDRIDGKPVVLNDGRPIMNVQPMKIYQADALIDRMRAAGTPCQAWYDDFEYRDELPVASEQQCIPAGKQ